MTGFTFEGDVCVDIDECATGDNVCQLLSVSTNTWVLTNNSTAETVTKVSCQTSPITDTSSQEPQVLSSHVKRSMNVK